MDVPNEEFFGFRYILYILKMDHIQKLLSPFLHSTHEEIGAFIPFLNEETLSELMHVYDLKSHAIHEKIVKMHFFYITKNMSTKERKVITLDESLSTTRKYPIMMTNEGLEYYHPDQEVIQIMDFEKVGNISLYFIDGMLPLE
jgi:hypothetical protein